MRLENTTWPKVQEYFKKDSTVIIGVGSIECHGRHMPLGTDMLIPNKLLSLIEEKTDVMIAPTIPYGATEYLREFPGTVSIKDEVLYNYLLCVVEGLYSHGARKFLILNGHGGNTKVIERVAVEMDKKNCVTAVLNWWKMVWDMDPDWKGGHGGAEETAAIMGIDPDLVDRSEIGPELKLYDVTPDIKTTGFTTVKFKGVEFNIPRSVKKVTDSGWVGPDHPSKATEEWGREMLSTCADYVADLAEEFKKIKV